ncbi:hypothetical protein LTR10_012521 [Elasticomyces elasticus]|nr:hypothetical protein LTR10_012521 [Elasticomyces elasticus]KAK4965995.1 hypothetical protein LTR42_012009 [Elasticomyces elasticus]
MGKSRSGTPSSARIKRDKSTWPKTAITTAKRAKKVGFARSPKGNRVTSPSPTDDCGDRADAMSIDKDTDDSDDKTAPLDPLHAIAIGHLILDNPEHRMYQQHVAALFDACGTGRAGSAQLQELIRHIHVKAEELELLGGGETAAAALTSAYCDRIATRLAESLASEEMLVEVTVMVLQRREYEVDSKAFLRSLKRKLRDTTGTSRELETNDTITETVPDSDHPEPATIARAVDVYWDRERLGQLDGEAAQTLVLSVIKSARDLFIVHQVADAEFEASQQVSSRLSSPIHPKRVRRYVWRSAFGHWRPVRDVPGTDHDSDRTTTDTSSRTPDLHLCCEEAALAWAQIKLSKSEQYVTRHEALRRGDMRKLASWRRDKSQRDLKEQYALRRQPLHREMTPRPITYVHVKTETPDSRVNHRPSLQHFVTQPPGPSTSSHASALAHPPPPSRVRQEMPSQQVITNQAAAPLLRPPPSGPAEKAAVILLLNNDPLVYRMRRICQEIFAKYGYVSVKRIGKKSGPQSREWLVMLRTAELAEAAVSSGVRVPGQNGRMYVHRGERT